MARAFGSPESGDRGWSSDPRLAPTHLLTDMGEHDISQVERLARRICKSLQGGLVAGDDQLLSLRNAGRRVQRRHDKAGAEDVAKAVELALSSGWLIEQNGNFSLTPAGLEVAKRSRVGRHKVRLIF